MSLTPKAPGVPSRTAASSPAGPPLLKEAASTETKKRIQSGDFEPGRFLIRCGRGVGAAGAVHGADTVQNQVSGYDVALEWPTAYPGRMIALPPAEWAVFGALPSDQLARLLRAWA